MNEGRKIDNWTVYESDVRAATRRVSMANVFNSYARKVAAALDVENYEEMFVRVKADFTEYDKLTENERDFFDIFNGASVWVTVCSVVKPYINIDEWQTLPESVIDRLTTAATELNPSWNAAPTEKKSKKSQRASSSE